MASINLHAEASASVTCVSNNFIDNYMKGLNGDDVKVYLRLLRCINDPEADFSIASTADCLGLSARNVRTSIDALSAAGILTLDYDEDGELCDICMRPLSAQMAEDGDGQMSFSFAADSSSDTNKETVSSAASSGISDTAEAKKASPVQRVTEEKKSGTDTDTDNTPLPSDNKKSFNSEDLENDPEIRQILFIAQRYLGTALNNKAVDTILYWHIDLGMSMDLIDYLMTSTLAAGKCQSRSNIMSYMNSIAISWHNNGINSVTAAKDEKKQHSENTLTVKTAFGISGNLVPAQLEFVDKWFNEWHFSKEMVSEACSRTMANISQPNFSYADTILNAWHEKGFTDLSQVEADDTNHSKITKARFSPAGKNTQPQRKNSFNSYSEKNSYDPAMESMLLKNNSI